MIEDFLRSYTAHVTALDNDIYRIVRFYYGLAHAQAYVHMVRVLTERAPGHPEIMRVPELLDILLEHFQTFPLEHIDIQRNQIFDENFVGTIVELEAWQQAGYPLERSYDDYDRRVEIFRAIWLQKPVTITISRTSKKGKQYFQKLKFNPLNIDVSYETVIAARNERYGELIRYIPFWLPLNYGTTFEVNSGYPVVEGLHFVDLAERALPRYIGRSLAMLEEFLASYLININESDSALNQAVLWAFAHTEYTETFDIDIFTIATELSK